MESFTDVASLGDVEQGELKLVQAEGEAIVLANVDGTLYAFSDECTHEGCNLSNGTLDGDEVECECHGSRFNVRTGDVINGPAAVPVPIYGIRIEGRQVLVGPKGD